MMKKIEEGLVVLMMLLIGVSQAVAGEWQIVGPRALGMGGANVAVANDATASYWNPGAFGLFDEPDNDEGDYGSRGWSSQLGVGVGAQIHEDLAEQVDKISKFDFEVLKGTLSATNVSNFIQLVDDLRVFNENKNRAVNILVNTGLRSQFGHFGLAVNVFGDVSAKGDIDLNNIAPRGVTGQFTIDEFTNPANYGCTPCPSDPSGGLDANQRFNIDNHLKDLNWNDQQRTNYIDSMDNGFVASGNTPTAEIVEQIKNVATTANLAAGIGGDLSKNDSKLLFKGIALVEVPLTYGRALSNDLSIGGNLKFMKARVYDVPILVFGKDEDFSDKLDQATDNFTEKTNFGIDLGALYRFGDDLRVGLVGRNLNSPKFGSIKERAQLRTGIAYKPLSFVTLAADIDLTKNDTTVGSNFKSQNLGGGLELRLFKILMIRGGAYKNLAENDIGLVYTAGIGLNLWLINIDIGAALSKDKTDIDGNSIPEEARGEFAISMLF